MKWLRHLLRGRIKTRTIPSTIRFDGAALLNDGRIVAQQPFEPVVLYKGDSLTVTYTMNIR